MDYKEKICILKSRNTIIEMLTDRGIDVPEYFKVDMANFNTMYENNNIDIFIDDPEQKVYVSFYNISKAFGKNDLKTVVGEIKEKYESDDILIIIVLKEKYSISVKKELTNIYYKNVEIFLQKKLQFNITKNVLVPKHVILSEDVKDEVLKKYSCKIAQLPKILHTDPVALYYGMKTGNICKIIRSNASSGETISYRVVK